MSDYDGVRLANLASRLDRHAAVLKWAYGIVGVAVGAGVGQVAPMFMPMITVPTTVMSLLLGALLGAGAGYLGHIWALSLRVSAQAALGQAKLEESLRSR